MNRMRKWFCVFATVALVPFAMPAFAADKLFHITMSQSFIGPGTPIPIDVTFYNESQSGGSSSVINSVQFAIPAGFDFTLVSWTTKNGGTTTSNVGTSDPPRNVSTSGPYTIKLSNITGVKTDGTLTVSLLIAASTCTTAQFKGFAWTGNTFGGTQFSPVSTNADGVQAGCTGTLGCATGNNRGGNLDPALDLAYGGDTPDWGLIRGPNLDDPSGQNCTVIPYQFNFDPATNSASFIADKGSQQVSVEYVVVWSPVGVDAAGSTAGWTARRPQLAWGFASTPTPAQYVPALACVIDDLSIGLAALPIIPNVAPFAGSPYAQYQPGQIARMCIAQQGWTSVGGGFVQYWNKVIDDSDGYVRLP